MPNAGLCHCDASEDKTKALASLCPLIYSIPLLSTSCSRVLLNGVPNQPIRHGRGLRQGDPLSPLLFVIAIDPLQKLLALATERGILSEIRERTPGNRISMYADDATLFLVPKQNEVSSLAELLTLFGEATGLKTIFHKSTVVPIHCAGLNMANILGKLPAKQSHFPIKYLGLPLTTARLRRIDFQPLVDKNSGKAQWLEREESESCWEAHIGPVGSNTSSYLFLVSTKAPKSYIGRV